MIPLFVEHGQSKGVSQSEVIEHFTEFHMYWSQAVDNATSHDWDKRWTLKFDKDIREGVHIGATTKNGAYISGKRDTETRKTKRGVNVDGE